MKPQAVIIHHTAGNEQTANQLRSIFKSRFGVDYIGYHRCISKIGKVWSDLKYTDVGIHNNEGKYNNSNSIGIAFVGNFENEEPTQTQLDTLKQLINEIIGLYGDLPIYGHKDMKATSCPGKNLYNKLKDIKKKEQESEVKMNPYDDKVWFEAHKNAVRGLYRKWLERESENESAVENWAKSNDNIGKVEDNFVRASIGEWKARLTECQNIPPKIEVKEIPKEIIKEVKIEVPVEKIVYKEVKVEPKTNWYEDISRGLSKLFKLERKK